MTVEIVLPSWQQCSEKHDQDAEMSALESFVYDNEPVDADQWRRDLAALIAEAVNEDRAARP